MLQAWLTQASKDLPENDPYLTAFLGGRSPEVAAEAAINGTKLADSTIRARSSRAARPRSPAPRTR